MDYKQQIIEISQKISELRDLKDRISKEWVIAESPVQVGDIAKANGYAFEGQEILVDSVSVKDLYKNEYCFRATGKVLKKDGIAGKKQAEWFSNRD